MYVIHGAKDELFELATTKKWVEKIKGKGTDLTFVVNEQLSHFDGCAYISDKKNAWEWLKVLWANKETQKD